MSVGDRLVQTWQPAPRPDWVRQVNREGEDLDIRSVVPLDPDYLIAAATRASGLADFGDESWREPFHVLARALDQESDLNLFGRILSSTELLAMLQARLRIEEQYKKHPEIAHEVIDRPTFILGQPRSGTSALQNLLAADPETRVFHTWEAWFPAPLDEADPEDEAKRFRKADRLSTMWNRVVPELEALHEINAGIPTECNVIHSLTFRSKTMVHLGQIPSYVAYMQAAAMKPAFEYHQRVLKLLQWNKPKCRWVLKSPDYIMLIPELLAQYPDTQLVYTHRDPVKAFGSGVSLIGTLQWMRSDHPYKYDNPNNHATSLKFIAALLNRIVDGLESGAIPRRQFFDVRYLDFIRDPMRAARQIYDYFGREMRPEALRAMQDHLSRTAENRTGHKHAYETVSPDEVAEARQIFARYETYFNVPAEI